MGVLSCAKGEIPSTALLHASPTIQVEDLMMVMIQTKT
jgi:hypothetical protein